MFGWIVFLLCFAHGSSAITDVFMEIFEQSRIKTVTILTCNESNDKGFRNFSSTLSKNQFHTRSLNIDNDEEFEEFLAFKTYFTHVLIDLNCNRSEKLLTKVSELSLFNTSRNFIFLENETLFSKLEKLNLNMDSKIQVVSQRSDQAFEIYEFVGQQVRTRLKVHFRRAGVFSLGRLKMEPRHSIRIDFEQKSFSSCVYIPSNPKGLVFMKYLTGTDEGHRDSVHRMGVQMFLILAEFFNFRVHWVRATSWGYLTANGTWTGCMGKYATQEVTFTVSPILYFPQRLPLLDSGLYVYRFREAFTFRHPKSGKGVTVLRNAFLLPFEDDVWISLLFASFVIFLIFVLVSRYEGEGQFPFPVAFLGVCGAISQQGISDAFNSIHGKIIIMVSLVMTFFVMQFYSSSIIGSLLTPIPKSIHDEATLMNSDLKIVLEDAPPSLKAFTWAGSEVTRQLYAKKVENISPLVSVEEGVKMAQKEGIVFFTFIDYAYDLIKKRFSIDELDELQEINIFSRIVESNMYFSIIKHSPYKELLRVGTMKMHERGIQHYWFLRWTQSQPIGNLESNEIAVVDFMHCSSLIYFVIGAFGFSGLILCGEIIVHKMIKLARQRTFEKVAPMIQEK